MSVFAKFRKGKKNKKLDDIFANMEVTTVKKTLKLDMNSVVIDPNSPFGLKGLSKEHIELLGAADLSKEEVMEKKDLVVKALDYFARIDEDKIQTRLIKKAIQTHEPKILYKDPYQKYKEIKLLGKGGFGTVSKYEDITSGEHVAIKRINLEDSRASVNEIKREIAFMELSGHENLLAYNGTYQFDGELWIVLELMEETMKSLIAEDKKWKEEEIAYVLRESLKGLNYLHQQNVIHRDIKSENILFNDRGKVKLADFGFAISLTAEQSKRYSMVGTPLYVAPEIAANDEYNTKVDIWSMGVVAVELAEGYPPMLRNDVNFIKQVLELLSKNPAPELAEPEIWSPAFNEVVRSMLVKNPTVRKHAKVVLKKKFFKTAISATDFIATCERLSKSEEEQEIEEEVSPTAETNGDMVDSDNMFYSFI